MGQGKGICGISKKVVFYFCAKKRKRGFFKMNLRKIILDIEIKDYQEKGLICEGLLFKGYSSIYYKDGEINRKEGLKLLKRKSCKGGEKCKSYDGENVMSIHCDHWFLDEMSEMLDGDYVIIPEIEDGALYRIRIANEITDWETGALDAFDFEFYKVEKESLIIKENESEK